MPTPVSCTPTPHYAPMEGTAYIVDYDFTVPLLENPDPTSRSAVRAPPGAPVEILDSVWYYVQNRYGDTYCYIYHVRIQGMHIEGWLEQDGITQEKGKQVPVEQMCFSEGIIPTPSYAPLSGTVFVNVGEEYGAAGTIQRDPRLIIRYVLTHGTRVEIVESYWAHYAANQKFAEILCYVYKVQIPDSTLTLWLPEDVLSATVENGPRRDCFHYRIPPSVLQISPELPKGYELVTTEPQSDS
ncbi:MAG: hypothetical protein JXA33_03755 [Anaerolineae bacterium]|nr:hypothetical protein [Anaerolineae bacterium]